MSNPLFNMLGGNNVSLPGNLGVFIQRLNQLKSMGGDPNQQIQNLLNSGRVTQEQYNNAVKQAETIRKMIGR